MFFTLLPFQGVDDLLFVTQGVASLALGYALIGLSARLHVGTHGEKTHCYPGSNRSTVAHGQTPKWTSINTRNTSIGVPDSGLQSPLSVPHKCYFGVSYLILQYYLSETPVPVKRY